MACWTSRGVACGWVPTESLPEKKIESAKYSPPAPEATAKAENLPPNNEIQPETLMPETLNAAGAFGGGDHDG